MAGRRRGLGGDEVSRFHPYNKKRKTTTTAYPSSEDQSSGQTLQPLSTVPPKNNTPEPQSPGLSTDLGLLTGRRGPNAFGSPRGQTPRPTNRNSTTSRWVKAFQMLSEDDKAALPSAGNETIEELLKDIKGRAELCAQAGRRVKLRGNQIAVRDVVDKLLTWVVKFESIGHIVMQYDPVHAVLPWAAIRSLLQISLINIEGIGVIMTGTERVARLAVRSAVYEGLYLGSTLSTPLHTVLANGLLDLYVTVLRFLACAKRYLVPTTAARHLRSIGGLGRVKSSFDAIEEREVLLEMDLKTAERESQNDYQIMLQEKTREMEKFFGETDRAVMLLHDEFRASTHDKKQVEVLKWLSTIEFIKHHQTAREGLLENTGHWLLKLKQFRQWRASRTSEILWLHGIPGAGKTKLTCMVIEFLQSLPQSDGPVVYFYCKRDDPHRRDPEVIMQAILKHLCLALKNLPSKVIQEYDKRREKGYAAGSLGFTECKNLIASLLNIYSHTTIIIDALDESDPDERWRLLESFENIIGCATSPVKIFVSSRDDIDIKLRLEKVPNHYIDTKDNTRDIERFVIREVTSAIGQRRLLYGTVSDSLKGKIISTVAERSHGMFQWADLQIKNLYRLKSPEEIEENLGKLPKTLEATYSRMWREILEETTDAQRKITEKALMWLICSRKPLDPKRWAEFTYWPEAVPQNGVDVLFDLCRNLTRWDKQVDRVVFAHLSVREFFESHIFTPVQANSMAAESCLLLLTNPDAHRGWTTSVAGGDISPFASYSVERWAGHVNLCYNPGQRIGNDMRDLLLRFLGTRAEPSKPYSDWLRAAMQAASRREHAWPPEGVIQLESEPLDPLFAMSYFRFGEELLPEFEAGLSGIDINTKNLMGEALLYVASNEGNERVMNLLLEKQADVNVVFRQLVCIDELRLRDTPLVVAIRKGHSGAVLKLLAKGATIMSAKGNRLGTLKTAVRIGSWDVIDRMISTDPGLEITEAVLVVAAGHPNSGLEMMQILLPRCPDTAITEAVLVSAAGNLDSSQEVIEILLPRCPDTAITEAVLVSAAENLDSSREVIEILLPRCPDTAITEAVLVSAAGNLDSSREVMEMLLQRCPDIAITKAVLAGAAENDESGREVMEILLPRCTDTIVTEAAMIIDKMEDWGVRNLLLSRCSEIERARAALKAAPGRTSPPEQSWPTEGSNSERASA